MIYNPAETSLLAVARALRHRQAARDFATYFEAAEQWAQGQGAAYLTGLIKASNAPSMKMVTALGFGVQQTRVRRTTPSSPL